VRLPVQSRFTENGDTRIHYLDTGGPDRGAPIVFVPGMTDVADDYIEIMPLLGRRTAVVEIRGHGRSDAPESGYDLATLRADVGAVMSRMQPPLLVARSPTSPLVDDAAWARYKLLFPHARLHEFHDSPHDIFRPDRGRFPKLVRELTGS
jgi:pimeloyl-ACP methyl ester carboxylesterase